MTPTTSLANNFEPRICRNRDARTASERNADRVFVGISASLFAATALLTIVWCASMSAMPGMPMPGGWTMSMVWMQMPWQTWLDAAGSFVGMWIVMMVAMMLPSLAPMLWAYRKAVGGTGEGRKTWLTTLAGLGYFFVWAVLGIAVYPLGVALAAVEMRHSGLASMAPAAVAAVVTTAGAIQFTSWKAHHLGCCRETQGRGCAPTPNAGAAWRHGLALGLRCVCCCANFTAVMLAIGVMDLRAMALVTAAINIERLAPGGNRAARAVGAALAGVGIFMIGRAAWMR